MERKHSDERHNILMTEEAVVTAVTEEIREMKCALTEVAVATEETVVTVETAMIAVTVQTVV